MHLHQHGGRAFRENARLARCIPRFPPAGLYNHFGPPYDGVNFVPCLALEKGSIRGPFHGSPGGDPTDVSLSPQGFLKQLLLSCQDATLDELEGADGKAKWMSSPLLLETPLLRQLVVALAKTIVAKYCGPPSPCETLVGQHDPSRLSAWYPYRFSDTHPELLLALAEPSASAWRQLL